MLSAIGVVFVGAWGLGGCGVKNGCDFDGKFANLVSVR